MFELMLDCASRVAERYEIAWDLVERTPYLLGKSLYWWMTGRQVIPHDVAHTDILGTMWFRLFQWLP